MIVMKTDLPGLKLHGRGKVRDIYDLGEHFLIIATDRLSAFERLIRDVLVARRKFQLAASGGASGK